MLVFLAADDIKQYKPIDIPAGMNTNESIRYKGKIEISCEVLHCEDGRPDPLPGQNAALMHFMHFVNILEWERK